MSRAQDWFGKLRPAPEEQRTVDLQRMFHGDAPMPRADGEADEPVPAIPGYRILQELGSGGMSRVWLAERTDGVVIRRVAVKLPQLDSRAPVDMKRFERERDILAQFEHRHIARLYDAGFTADGRPFMVLENIHGAPITEYCDAHRLTITERLALFLQVLTAVRFSHSNQVVHRDLKPSNVLVDEHGQVKLLDFGIAKTVSDPGAEVGAPPGGETSGKETPDVQLTQAGKTVATLQYAAPEQLEDGKPITTATDIYVLGMVLYELLTGVHPHMQKLVNPSRRELAEIVKKGPLIRPSSAAITDANADRRRLRHASNLRTALKRDLDDIVCKAMQIQHEDRYASAGQFADDISRSLAHRPIEARQKSWVYSTSRFLRRNLAASLAAGLGVCAALVIGTVALRQYQQARLNDARAIAVRNFIFDLVNDAEPSESQTEEVVTGKQMVDAAVRRARVEFEDQPRLRGELLGELGRMYGRLGTPDSEKSLLREALGLLELNAPEDDPALNKTRAHVAELELAEDDIEGARKLAALSRSSCTRADAECAKARAYGDRALASIALREARTDVALAEFRRSVAETERGFGAQHSETAMAYANLAVMARNAGYLEEATAAIERALRISQHQTLRFADRRMIQQTVAVLDIDIGRYREASDRLESLLERPATPSERALQSRLLANALLLQRRADAAIAAADRAIAAATEAGEATEILFARQARARALALNGSDVLAQSEIEAVIAGLLKTGRAADSPAVVRARRAQAEILARAGRWPDAYEKLQGLVVVEFERGESLDLLGCTALEMGRQQEALSLHRRARTLLEKKLPADHPLLQRNTLFQEAAVAKQGSAPGCAHIL